MGRGFPGVDTSQQGRDRMTELDRLDQFALLFETTHQVLCRHAAKSVDAALVARNWLFGWYLEEFERARASRAEIYGKGVMAGLADRLRFKGIRGCSVPSLNRFRQFYRAHAEIRSTVLSESGELCSSHSIDTSEAAGWMKGCCACSREHLGSINHRLHPC